MMSNKLESLNNETSPRHRIHWPFAFVLVAAVFGFALVAPQAADAKGGAANHQWVGTWSSSPVEKGEVFEGQTLRQIVRISAGGDQLRIRFSNRFGEAPLIVDSASVGIQDAGAAVVPGSLQELTFGGSPSIAIAAGAKVWSDPVQLSVPDEADLAISLYVAENATGRLYHAHIVVADLLRRAR